MHLFAPRRKESTDTGLSTTRVELHSVIREELNLFSDRLASIIRKEVAAHLVAKQESSKPFERTYSPGSLDTSESRHQRLSLMSGQTWCTNPEVSSLTTNTGMANISKRKAPPTASMRRGKSDDEMVSWMTRPRRSNVPVSQILKKNLFRGPPGTKLPKKACQGSQLMMMDSTASLDSDENDPRPSYTRLYATEGARINASSESRAESRASLLASELNASDQSKKLSAGMVTLDLGTPEEFTIEKDMSTDEIAVLHHERNGSAASLQRETWRMRRMDSQHLAGDLFQEHAFRASVTLPTPLFFVVTSSHFTSAVGMIIGLNALLLGVETDYRARHSTEDTPPVFLYSDCVFCVLFSIELTMRIHVYRWSFFTTAGWEWNMFDLAMVIWQVIDVSFACVSSFSHNKWGQSHVGILRMVRIFRLLRVLRLARLLSVFSELRMFIISITDSLRSLLWTIMLITLVMYIGGVYLTQVVTDTRMHSSEDTEALEDLEMYYGTLDRSMLTLYQTISEGVHWRNVMQPLSRHCSPWMALVFSLWMAFTVFAMLNVITGVFVESALRTASDDQKKLLMYQMGQWFADADTDHTQTISWEEFQESLSNPKMENFLKIVDLDREEAWDLFHLLDAYGTGEIPIDDFVNGCVRVTGTAKALDLVTFMHQYKLTSTKFADEFSNFRDFVEDSLTQSSEDLARILSFFGPVQALQTQSIEKRKSANTSTNS